MKRRTKIVWLCILVFLLLIAGFGLYEYYNLKPQNHFASVPVLNSKQLDKNKITSQPQKFQKDVFNILLIGSDERKGDNVGHSDSMMLVHVDLNKHEYHAISIPRDTRVYLGGYGYTKLTSVQYIMQATKGQKAGVLAAAKAITQFTGVPINYYVETNYSGLQSMVNALGTVKVNVPFDVKLTHPWYKEDAGIVIEKGTHIMDGKMVTELVHERYSLAHGEYDRQLLQEKALAGIAKAAVKPKNLTKLPNLVSSIDKFVIDTNMSTSDMISLGWAVKDFDPNKDLQYYQLKGKGMKVYDDILKAKNDEIIIDQKIVEKVIYKFNN